MYVSGTTLEAARRNCELARRRIRRSAVGSQRRRDAVADLARFESQAATLGVEASARAAGFLVAA
jgi:hypothetical protein